MSAPTDGPLPPNVTHAPVFVGVLSAFFVLSTLFFAARIYTRVWILKKFWWDDAVLILAMICLIPEYATQMVQADHGYGRHAVYVSPSDITLNLKIGYAAQLIWVWTVTLVKISMCLLLIRIRPGWSWGLIPFALFQLAIGLGTTVVHFLRCSPIAANWDPTLANVRCWSVKNISNSYYVQSALFITSDFVLALLPITFINKIRRPMREKGVLVFLMGFGLFASACAIAKLALFSESPIVDPTYDPINLGIWAHLELFVGIIAACVPCLKAPFEQILVYFGLLKEDRGTKFETFSKFRSPGEYKRNPILNSADSKSGGSDELVMRQESAGTSV